MGQLILGTAAYSAAQSRSAPVNFSELSARADAARDANRLEEAIPLYKQALALRPGWAEGWWSLGTICYDQNSYSEAATAFRNVIALAPNNGTAYVMLGLSEFELGRDDLALKHIKKGTSLGLNTNPELRHVALYHEGVLWQRQGKFQAAQETLEQLCLQGVQSDEVASALGMTLLRQRSRSVPHNSPDVEIVSRIGHAECLAGQKKFDQGRSDLSALVATHPTFPEIHYAFGLFLIDANDVPAAVAEFKEEIKNNPVDVVSRLQIAAATYKIDSAAGLPYAEESVKLAPRQPFGHLLLGLLMLDTGDDRRAIPELEAAQKAFPRETKIYIALGTAYSRAGRKQDAARARATFLHLTEEARRSQAGSEPPAGEADDARMPVGDAPSNQ
jgi:tetratricopeptide (TPR) repeat protein